MKKLFAILAIAITCAVASASTSHGHDGVWWHTKSPEFKEAFIIGYKAGTANASGGHNYLSASTALRYVDGLNSFYNNFRNTNIHVEDAIVYVKDEIDGKDSDTLAAELDTMRKNATAAGYGTE